MGEAGGAGQLEAGLACRRVDEQPVEGGLAPYLTEPQFHEGTAQPLGFTPVSFKLLACEF